MTILTAPEAEAINREVARIEARTGVEIVAVVTRKSNHYPQIPWKAFALGAALAAIAFVIADLLHPSWPSSHLALVEAVAILGTGATLAVLTVFSPAAARIFLRGPRRDLEVHRYAHERFLRHEVFATRSRTGVLLLLSLFERKIEIVADRGYDGRIGAAEWRRAIVRIAPVAATLGPAAALQEGLTAIESLLVEHGYAGTAGDVNELPDAPREEAGP